jgi:CheY-like chemotaxis protein
VDINREIIAALLEDTGIDITFAFNGADAVRLAAESPDKYKLILMDVHMPEMDGYTATMQIRSAGNNTPIIAMTANVFREDIENCLAAGMNSHLGKPLDFEKVLEELKKYLGADS